MHGAAARSGMEVASDVAVDATKNKIWHERERERVHHTRPEGGSGQYRELYRS
jgi:hypothetical protein